MSNFILQKGSVYLMPFRPKDAEFIYKWQYDKRYAEFFRHSTFLSFEEAQTYPQRMNALVFMVFASDTKTCLGLIQAIPNPLKNNRSCFVGLLVEEEHQQKNYGVEALTLFSDILFNRLAYDKTIVEVLPHRKELIKRLNTAGFVNEGLMRNEVFFNGKYYDEVRYSMSREYYNKHYTKAE